MQDDNKEAIYYIPANYDGGWVAGNGKGLQHILEAAIVLLIIVVPILCLPLDGKYKGMLCVLLGLPAAIGIYMGKNGCLVSKYFLDYVNYKRGPHLITAAAPFNSKHEKENRKNGDD